MGIFFFLASLCWAGVTFVSSSKKIKTNILLLSFYMYLVSALIAFLMIDFRDITRVFYFNQIFWVNTFFLSVIVTSIATTVYFKSTLILGPSLAAFFIFLVPVVALISGIFFFKEENFLSTIVGSIFCVGAVILINHKPKESSIK